jgi:FMN phosphatase YigB (HAD superfamily)
MQSPILALAKKFERGQLTIAEYLVEVKNIYHIDHSIGVDDLERIWQTPFELNTDVWQIALKLRRQVPLFLLSNTNALHIRAIRRKFNILENMDGLILSFEVGATNPESAIYQYALRKSRGNSGTKPYLLLI